MLDSEWRITIPGTVQPKGSLKCVGRRGKRAHVLLEDNKDSTPWRKAVTGWLVRKWPTKAAPRQPLGAEVTFTLARPAGHYGTGRNAGRLKPSAPAFPTTHGTGDVDKLLRLILDAMQDAGHLVDDAQVIEVTTRKAYVLSTGTDTIAPLDPDPYDRLPYPGVCIRLYPIREDTYA